MKNMDRFRRERNCVLVASDVAARGLDVPNVDCVLHYGIPRNTQTFIHRAGRSARAGKEGRTIIIQTPRDRRAFFNIVKGVGEESMEKFIVHDCSWNAKHSSKSS